MTEDEKTRALRDAHDKALVAARYWQHRFETSEAERIALAAHVERIKEGVMNAPVASGVCCCGEAMDGHSDPMMCGHDPVDEWDYYKGGLFDDTPDESLARLRAD